MEFDKIGLRKLMHYKIQEDGIDRLDCHSSKLFAAHRCKRWTTFHSSFIYSAFYEERGMATKDFLFYFLRLIKTSNKSINISKTLLMPNDQSVLVGILWPLACAASQRNKSAHNATITKTFKTTIKIRIN